MGGMSFLSKDEGHRTSIVAKMEVEQILPFSNVTALFVGPLIMTYGLGPELGIKLEINGLNPYLYTGLWGSGLIPP